MTLHDSSSPISGEDVLPGTELLIDADSHAHVQQVRGSAVV